MTPSFLLGNVKQVKVQVQVQVQVHVHVHVHGWWWAVSSNPYKCQIITRTE